MGGTVNAPAASFQWACVEADNRTPESPGVEATTSNAAWMGVRPGWISSASSAVTRWTSYPPCNGAEAHNSRPWPAASATGPCPRAASDAGTWVRLAWRRPGKINPQAWTGFEAALAIKDVPRPVWLAAAAWHDTNRDVIWRAEEMTTATAPVISKTATIATDPFLPEQWWSDLRAALNALAAHETARTCISQAHLSSRISDAYGDGIDTTISDWACVHGDIGWANLCGPALSILDWEDWGIGPEAFDVACLWAASLRVPPLAQKVLKAFDDVLSTRTGRLCQLMLCANVARAYKRTGQETPLTETMAAVAEEIMTELR